MAAPQIVPLGSPSNQLGGPGTCRAKWRVSGDGEAGTATIANAALVAAFTNANVPAEALAALNATYANQAAARDALDNGMQWSLSARLRGGGLPTTFPTDVNVDATPGKATLTVVIPAVAGDIIVELEFHHSKTR